MKTLLAMTLLDPSAVAQWPSIEERAGEGWRVRVIYRIGCRQIEHVLLSPNIQVFAHRHPHIDTYEIYLRGTLELQVDDHHFIVGPHLRPSRRVIAIRHDQYHGGIIGQDGAEFLSLQDWMHEPTSTAEDWDGPNPKAVKL